MSSVLAPCCSKVCNLFEFWCSEHYQVIVLWRFELKTAGEAIKKQTLIYLNVHVVCCCSVPVSWHMFKGFGAVFVFWRWKQNDSFILLRPGSRYSLVGGNMHISHLNKEEDVGIYQCLASNSFGTIVSREASLHVACKSNCLTHLSQTLLKGLQGKQCFTETVENISCCCQCHGNWRL